ncbi:MAG: hypothetical protein JW896_05905 [Deltaproteobacteria bacterium]|nr:hypothetical protein [Deltaproteobacteria bacterium]
MKKDLKTRLIIALFLSFVFFSGCLPETRIIRAPSKPEVIAPPPSPITILDDDIAFLERILRKSELNNEDAEMAEDLLSAYRMVRDYFLRKDTAPDYDRIIQKLYETLVRLDHQYFLKRDMSGPPYSETITAISEARDMIRNKFFLEDYLGVVTDTMELKTVFGPDAISVDIGFLLAVALGEMGMKEEANILGSRLIDEFEARPDLAFLQSLLIDWQLDLGNKEMVLQIYRELMDHMDKIMEGYQAGDVTEGLLKDLVDQRTQREKEARLVYEEEALIWARQLIEEERHEEAIRRINELGDDQDMSLEMKELKELALEGFINQERDKAAAHLLIGRQTTDPDKKKEFFLLSYNRLRALTEKYPQSSLTETLNEDMKTVKTELDKLGNAVEY